MRATLDACAAHAAIHRIRISGMLNAAEKQTLTSVFRILAAYVNFRDGEPGWLA